MNRISRCDWLSERARWLHLARSRYGLCPASIQIMLWCCFPYNKSFIDQACSVKMAGYWPRSFFACLWTETNNHAKKRTWQISSHLNLTSRLVNNPYILITPSLFEDNINIPPVGMWFSLFIPALSRFSLFTSM